MIIVRHPRNVIASLLLIIVSFAATSAYPHNDGSQLNIALDEIRTLAANIGKETERLTYMEERLKSEMKRVRDRTDSALGKIMPEIQNVRTELTNVAKRQSEMSDRMDSNIGELKPEIQSVRTELTNVEQRLQSELSEKMDSAVAKNKPEFESVRTELTNLEERLQSELSDRMESAVENTRPEFENVRKELGHVGQKLEETLLMGMEEAGNRTIDAFRRDQLLRERPKNCEEIQLRGHNSSGVYRVYPLDRKHNANGKDVYCDLLTDGGGWTVMQRRKESLTTQEDFDRTWDEYASGFGNLYESHWIGLDVIAALTRSGDNKLRIEMTDWEGDNRVAAYNHFRIANASDLYRINVSGYSGDAGDSLAYHNGAAFSTKDRDYDEQTVSGFFRSCAQSYGAWWFRNGHESNLNGMYFGENNAKNLSSSFHGIIWKHWRGYSYSLKRTEIKFRSNHFQT